MSAEEIYNFIRSNPSKGIKAVDLIEQYAKDKFLFKRNELVVALSKKYDENMYHYKNTIPDGEGDDELDALADNYLERAKGIKSIIDLLTKQ